MVETKVILFIYFLSFTRRIMHKMGTRVGLLNHLNSIFFYSRTVYINMHG